MPANRLPIADTATITTTSSSATFVFDQLDRHGSRMAAAARGAAMAAANAAWSRVRLRVIC